MIGQVSRPAMEALVLWLRQEFQAAVTVGHDISAQHEPEFLLTWPGRAIRDICRKIAGDPILNRTLLPDRSRQGTAPGMVKCIGTGTTRAPCSVSIATRASGAVSDPGEFPCTTIGGRILPPPQLARGRLRSPRPAEA